MILKLVEKSLGPFHYSRVGVVSSFEIFGYAVYLRVDTKRMLLGFDLT